MQQNRTTEAATGYFPSSALVLRLHPSLAEHRSFLLLVVMPGVPSSFLLLLVRHLLLEVMHLLLVASCS